jgi:hypothetical protein
VEAEITGRKTVSPDSPLDISGSFWANLSLRLGWLVLRHPRCSRPGNTRHAILSCPFSQNLPPEFKRCRL